MSQAEEEPLSVRSVSAPLLPEAASEEPSAAAAESPGRSRHDDSGSSSDGGGLDSRLASSRRSSSQEGSATRSLAASGSSGSSGGGGFIWSAVSALRRLRRRIQRRLPLPPLAWRFRVRGPRDADNSNRAGGGQSAEWIRNSNARRLGRRNRSRSRTNGEDSSARLRLRALRAVLRSRGAVSRQIISRAAEAAALAGGDEVSLAGGTNVWNGVFTSLSPTDTGGVFFSLLCALLLAVCLFFCTETAQPSLHRSKQEILVWAFVETVSSLILNYASFLGAICLLAVFQWRRAKKRQQRRLQLRLQREWMRHVREVCEDMQRRGQAEQLGQGQTEQQQQTVQQDQKAQQKQPGLQQKGQQQSKGQQQQAGSSQNNAPGFYGNNTSNEEALKLRKSSAEVLQMLSELEKLAALELQLTATDSELEELAERPEKIGSAWLSADCRASLYRARGQEDTAFARLQLM